MSQSQLEKANALLSNFNEQQFTLGDETQKLGLEEYLETTIRANLAATIGIRYVDGTAFVTTVFPDSTKLYKFNNYTPEMYNEMCEDLLKIDMSEEYNCSRTCIIGGVRTRVYCVMPPFVNHPNITISTTKTPPATLNKKTISDDDWNKIVHSNFIVVGQSGSGKTYLTNYLLNKYIRPDERIAIIEEFGEIIPPNELTSSIIVPPPKPEKPSLLKFVTEQSNLMRLDAIYVGEIKAGEAWPFVVNLASGTRGGATLHGETAPQALNRLRALCKLSCDNDEAIDEFIAKSINYIVVMRKKNIYGIYKLTGIHNKNSFAMTEIYS